MTLSPKYPHSEGVTCLAYSPCGRYLFTTGSNMLVRRFTVGSANEPDTIELDHSGLSIDVSRTDFVVSTSDGHVHVFDLEADTAKGLLTRAVIPIRELNYSRDGRWVAAAGDDTASVIGVDDITQVLSLPSTQTRHLSFRGESHTIVAASCLDGSVRVYDMSESPNVQLLHTIESVLPSIKKSDDIRTSSAAWSPDGTLLALPSKTFDIVVYSSESWLEEFRLQGSESPLTDLVWSPNGAYIAGSTTGGSIVIWSVADKKIVRQHNDIAGACQIRWHPHGNIISFTTDKGQLYTIDGVPEDLPAPFGDVVVPRRESEKKRRLLEAEIADLQDEPMSDDSLFLSNDDDEGQAQSKKLRKEVPTIQRPFQAGSTPWLNQKRYLCMNSTGYVWTVMQDASHNSVTVCFFDQGVHRDFHFTDSDRFDLACITQQGCVFANSDSGRVVVRFHGAAADNWEYDLPGNDTVQSVALSDEVVVVCTGKGFVRTFTLFGSPLFVSRQSRDPVVTCAAHSNVVMVVRGNNSGLTYTLEDAGALVYFQKDDVLEVPSTATLHTLFFTETGDPCICDSTGILSVLVQWRRPYQARWVPLFDGREYARQQNRQENYWPIGVAETKLVCVILKGQQAYPPIPLPVTSEIDLAIPGVDGVEGEYLVRKALYGQIRERADHLGLLQQDHEELDGMELDLDKLLLRQLQAACTENRINKGLRIAAQLQQQEALEAAAKVALHFNLTTLADRILQSTG